MPHAVPHLFVTLGDLTNLECDAWLLPSPSPGHAGSSWKHVDGIRAAFDRSARVPPVGWAVPPRDWALDRPLPVSTALPRLGSTFLTDLESNLEAFVRTAAAATAERRRRGAPTRRAKPLFAFPFFSSKGGGGAAQKGAILEALLVTARRLANEHDVDLVLVAKDPRAFALAQVLRRRISAECWPSLPRHLLSEAERLGRLALDGRLVPFMGAGVSASAGAPTWMELLRRLAEDAELTPDERRAFDAPGRSTLDLATFLRTRYETLRQRSPERPAFNSAVAELVRLERYGLAPTLLAGLRTGQAITLNYDELFEIASLDAGVPRALLPHLAGTDADAWLLKLHGSVEKSDSIVLTREDYLAFSSGREALSAIVKSSLITHHLVFVGFGMRDDHVHEIVHDVRRAIGETGREGAHLATAITLSDDPITSAQWGTHVDVIPIGTSEDDLSSRARTLEIFLDAVLAYANDSHGYLLDPSFHHALTNAERELRDALATFADSVPEAAKTADGWRLVESMLKTLGAPTDALREPGDRALPPSASSGPTPPAAPARGTPRTPARRSPAATRG